MRRGFYTFARRALEVRNLCMRVNNNLHNSFAQKAKGAKDLRMDKYPQAERRTMRKPSL